MTHQFNLYPNDKPKAKIPLKKKSIEALKKAIAAKNNHEARERMSDLLEYLENIERRISNGKYYGNT